MIGGDKQVPVDQAVTEVDTFGAQPERPFGGKQFYARRLTLAVGETRTIRFPVVPDYVIVASADATDIPFDVCFGDSFVFENSVRVGLRGRAILPAAAPNLTLRGNAVSAADVIILAQRGYPATDYSR